MKLTGNFEDLYVWQDAIQLGKDIYSLFDKCTVYSIKSQIERASLSISANIAEGFELGTNRQFIKHLYIAKGSCGEVRSLLTFALEIGLFPKGVTMALADRAKKLSIMIYKLIKSQGGSKE